MTAAWLSPVALEANGTRGNEGGAAEPVAAERRAFRREAERAPRTTHATTKRGGTGAGRMSGVERGPHSQIWGWGQAGGRRPLGVPSLRRRCARGLIMRPRWSAEVCLTPTSNGAVRARSWQTRARCGGRQMTHSATPLCSACVRRPPRPRLVDCCLQVGSEARRGVARVEWRNPIARHFQCCAESSRVANSAEGSSTARKAVRARLFAAPQMALTANARWRHGQEANRQITSCCPAEPDRASPGMPN